VGFFYYLCDMWNLEIIKTFLPDATDRIWEVNLEGDKLLIEYTVKIRREFSLSDNSFWSTNKVRHINLIDYYSKLRQTKLDNLLD
jgi:hypothetical protein